MVRVLGLATATLGLSLLATAPASAQNTRDDLHDGPLIEALKTGCFYIGALGSRKTHQRRVERLHDAGIAQSAIDRIDAPIGADIGAATPGEIAVAIMASVIEAFRKRKMFAERRGEEATA